MSIGFSEGDVAVYLAREALEKWWSGSQTGVGGGVNGDAEMGVVTHSFEGRGYKGEERHRVVAGQEYGVKRGLIFKMGNDVECRWRGDRRRGDDEISENHYHHHHCRHQRATTKKACSFLGLLDISSSL